MDKSEFPSSAYLQSLREQGIIPRSLLLTRSICCFFIVAAVLIFVQTKTLNSLYRDIFSAKELTDLLPLWKQFFLALSLPLAGGVIGGLLLGFFQTRFRLQPLFFRRNYKSDFYKGGALIRLITPILKIAGSLLAAFIAIIMTGRYWLLPLVSSDSLLSEQLYTATLRLGFLALGLFAVLIAVTFFASRVRFLYEHRVSADFNEERDDPKVGRIH